jgi:hypothetical protein
MLMKSVVVRVLHISNGTVGDAGKGKVVLVHSGRAYGGIRSIAPLNLGTRWR